MRLEISRFLRIFKECSFGGHCFLSMLAFDAICRVWVYWALTELPSEFEFECYLSWPDTFWRSLLALRSRLWMLFVVAGGTFGFYCFSSMLDFAGICRGRTRFWKPLLVFDAWFWCYLSWPEALLDFIVCLRCLVLMLFVVFQSTWPFYCLHWMFVFDAICRGRNYF